jgi:hypothetical protein
MDNVHKHNNCINIVIRLHKIQGGEADVCVAPPPRFRKTDERLTRHHNRRNQNCWKVNENLQTSCLKPRY